MKHIWVHSAAVWLVLVSAAGCGDSSVGSSEKPASSPVAIGASIVTANEATVAADAAAVAAKAADAAASTAEASVAKPADAAATATTAAKPVDAATATAAKAVDAAIAAPKAADAATPPAAVPVPVALSADADAAQALFKKDGCTKCHAIDRTKTGPAMKKVAADLKGKADAQATIVKFISTGPKIKLDDGSEEDHKILSSKDTAVLKNMANWILLQ